MTKVWILVVGVVAALLVERVTIGAATRSPRGRAWIRAHPLLHPNSISLIRIPMGLVGVGLFILDLKSVAVLWFSLWMISDLTDGTIARNCDLLTETGKWLDPLSDKCMYFPALAFFAGLGAIPATWAVAVILIDTSGQLSRLVIRKKAANYFGKAKTALITVLLALVALNQIGPLWFMSDSFVYVLTVSCALLAFLSVYCKMIPDTWYANSLTLANFLCGIAAIWNIYHSHPLRAFILIFVGQFFDLFDGRLARKFGSTRMGALFDDIADGTSFGLAVGLLILAQLGGGASAGVLVALYLLCVVYRLYRFVHPTRTLPGGIFQGLPSPAGAMLAGAATLLFAEALPILAAAFVVFASLLMISSLPYRHFGQKIWPELPNSMRLLSVVLVLIFVNISISDKNYAGAFTLFAFTLAMIYVIFGIEYKHRPETAEQPAPNAP